MPQEYVLFDLQFFEQSAGHYNVSVTCPLVPGDTTGLFSSPASDTEYQQRFERLQALDTDEDLLIALGRQLFSALFQGRVRDAYITARGKLTAGQGLRLRFNIDPRQLPEVAGLPWEFLCDEDDQPLVLLDTPIVRYLPRFAAPPTIATPRPLKILLTAAVTEPAFDVTRELDAMRATLAELAGEGTIELAIEEHLTGDILEQRLREGFHMWHFIGHGKLNRDGSSGLLVFEDASGEAEDVSARELGIILRDSALQLIILDACNSGRLTTRPYRSLAPALMLADIGAVIAMQFKAPQEATRPFARAFYQALIAGEAIDSCVTRGRRAVMLKSRLRNPDWGIPTVYTRAPDARLFAPPDAPTPPPPVEQPARSQPGGGISVSIGDGNTLNNSPITIGATPPGSREAADDQRYDQQLGELLTLLASTRSARAILLKKQATQQSSVGDLTALADAEAAYDRLQRQLVDLRKTRLSDLERRAAQPGGPRDQQIADLRAAIADESLEITRRELFKLEGQLRIQTNARDSARVQAQIKATQDEIADLVRQRNAA